MTDTIERLSIALADRYRLVREVGAGGMAVVYLAHDLKHDRDVAIKVLHPDLGATLGGERFLSEIRTTARLQHPHILPLLDSGDADGMLYYVMPLVSGETLRARLDREKQLPIDDALLIAREVADALGYAHKLGVIHRDIKPENILLQDGHALVADFGIALAVQSAGGARMTQTGLSLGTPQYMSPEQAMGERDIDARTDIYALGAVTYEMLTGDPPFTGSTAQAVVAQILTAVPRPLRTIRPNVAPSIDRAVLTALEKLPADRHATAAEFVRALARETASSSVDGRADISMPSTPQDGARARTWAVIAAALLLIVVSMLAGWGVARLSGRGASVEPLTMTSILAPQGGNFAERNSLALTPDGRALAFVFTAADGARSLWLRHLDRLDAEPISKTTGADAPFWSRDGRTLGFFKDGLLVIRDASGGTRQLCPAGNPTGASWGANDVILFGYSGGIATVSANGGPCKVIIARKSGMPFTAAFLPDGEHFVYSRGRSFDLGVARLDGSVAGTLPIRSVYFTIAPGGFLVTTAPDDPRALDAQRINLRSLALEGTPIRFASDVRLAGNIVSASFAMNGAMVYMPGMIDQPYIELDASGVLRDTVRMEGTWTLGVRPSRAGPPLVAIGGLRFGLFLYDLEANRATRLATTDSGASTTAPRGGAYPVFSPDGSRLVYSLNPCRMAERDLKTDAERVVLRDTTAGVSPTCPSPMSWSTDGKYVLVRHDTTLMIVSSDDWHIVQQIVRPGHILEGAFSPDGRWVAYSSDENGRTEVYVQALPTGSPSRVSTIGGRWPAWSSDGHRLWLMTPDGRVQVVPIASGGATTAPRTLFTVPTWRHTLFEDRATGFAVLGDGQRFFVRMSPAGEALAYTQHWSAIVSRADSTRGASAH